LIAAKTEPCVNPACATTESAWRRRGLCYRCYADRDVRERHPRRSKYRPDTFALGDRPAPTRAQPGSVEKMMDFARREAVRQRLAGGADKSLEPGFLAGAALFLRHFSTATPTPIGTIRLDLARLKRLVRRRLHESDWQIVQSCPAVAALLEAIPPPPA
jgi:hypothetical protein